MTRTAMDLDNREIELMNEDVNRLDLPPRTISAFATARARVPWTLAIHTEQQVRKWAGIGPAIIRDLHTWWKSETGALGFPFGIAPINPKLFETIDIIDIRPYLRENIHSGHPEHPNQRYLWAVCSKNWLKLQGHHPWELTKMAIFDFELNKHGLRRHLMAQEAFGLPRPTSIRKPEMDTAVRTLLTRPIPREDLTPEAHKWCKAHAIDDSAFAIWQLLQIVRDCPHRIELENWFARRQVLELEPHSADILAILHGTA